jgi:hypothetical protein
MTDPQPRTHDGMAHGPPGPADTVTSLLEDQVLSSRESRSPLGPADRRQQADFADSVSAPGRAALTFKLVKTQAPSRQPVVRWLSPSSDSSC